MEHVVDSSYEWCDKLPQDLWLETTEIYPHGSGSQNSKTEASAGSWSSEGSGKESDPAFS